MNDPDEDTFGNIYEYVHGTDPQSALSVPPATVVLSPGNSIQTALDNATNAYDIIMLSDGAYSGESMFGMSFPGPGVPVMLTSSNWS